MEANHIYQYSLLNALMSGVCESGITASNLLSKACNQGLGTFTRMDGELVLLDGHIYQLRPHGQVREASSDDQIPFVMAINFESQKEKGSLTLRTKSDIDDQLNELNGEVKNLFLAYRIEGTFAYVKYRTVQGQEYRGQPLSELGKRQNVEEYEHIEGTVIGFRSPENWQGFSVAGEHLHFISADRTKGGHVLEVASKQDGGVKLQIAVASNVHIEMPTSEDFNAAQLLTDDAGVKAVEG